MPRWGWKIGLGVVAVVATVWLLWPSPDVGERLAPLSTSEPRALTHDPGAAARDPSRSTPTPVATRVDEPAERRPGTLSGRVLDSDGLPVVGATMSLLADDGVIDSVKVDEEGHYALVDDLLIGTRLVAAGQERELMPLMEGEDRKLDVVVGDTREIVGWVLDLAGDPVAGVRVTVRSERAEIAWSAWTDAGGAFDIKYVPATVVRVTADGGELGLSSARLAQTNATRREVTLVLEPTGTLVVQARPEVGSAVIVRAWDNEAHGADGVYNDDMRVTEPRPPDFEVQMMGALTDSLARFDASRPEDSLVFFATAMVGVDPNVERELRRDAMKVNPDFAGAPLDQVVRAAVQKVIRDEPKIIEMMALASTYVKQGKSGMDAMMEASRVSMDVPMTMDESNAIDEAEPYEEAAYDEAILPADGDYDPTEDEIINEGEIGGDEGESSELEPVAYEDLPIAAEPVAYDGDNVEDVAVGEDLQAQVQRETGASVVQYAGEERAIVARGKTFEEIALRGAFVYQVFVRHASGLEILCGEVTIPVGQTVTMQCGDAVDAVVSGRVVGSDGRPIVGLDLELSTADADYVKAESQATGRFEIHSLVDRSMLQSLRIIDPAGRYAEGSRLNISVTPGGHTELGTIVVRRPDEVPDVYTHEPFGGVGAALSTMPKGIVFSAIGPDSPLALEGVEEGTTVVSIDDQDALTFSIEDAIAALRGDVGTEVALRLRSAEGELYDVLVARGLIDPGAGGPSDGAYETPEIEIE